MSIWSLNPLRETAVLQRNEDDVGPNWDHYTEEQKKSAKAMLGLVFSPDDLLLYSSSSDLTAHSWDPKSGSIRRILDHVQLPGYLTMSRDGTTAALSLFKRDSSKLSIEVMILDPRTFKEKNRFVLDAGTSHKEQARTHLQAIVDNTALRGFPLHQRALERLEGLDRIFSVVRFAAAQEDESVDEGPAGPASITAIPITLDQVPQDLKLILEQGGNDAAEGSDKTDEQP